MLLKARNGGARDNAMSQTQISPITMVRDFWNRRPCNIRHSTKPVGTKDYFDEVEKRKYFVEPHIPAFAQFERWQGKRVLEIGCGIGTDTMNFARAGAEVTAVDFSDKSLEIARQRAGVYGLSNIRFYHGNAEDLSSFLPVEPYDLIYSFGVIHHTPHPERIIQELHRYCHSHTLVKVMVYHRYSWKALEILLREGHGAFWKFSELVERHSEAQTGSPVTYSYTRRSVRKLLRGFAIDSILADHIFPYRVADYVQYRYVKIWYFRHLPNFAMHWLEKRLGWHLCVNAHSTGDVDCSRGSSSAALSHYNSRVRGA
jgi:ubiquinone/menaquinone biosynthesis C-methylase UbiE